MTSDRMLLTTMVLAALALPGCSATPGDTPAAGPDAASARPDSAAASATTPRPPPGVQSVYVWQCDDGRSLTMRNLYPPDDAIVLQFEDGERRLERVRTASGAKYQDGALSFWTKGSEALLEVGDGPAVSCRAGSR